MDDPEDKEKPVLTREYLLKKFPVYARHLERLAKMQAAAAKEKGETCTFEFSHVNPPPKNCPYKGEQSFEKLAEKMENVTDNGLIKKFVLKEGHLEKIPQKTTVTIHCKGFYEYHDEPFYISRREGHRLFRFTIGKEWNIPGFDIAILTMKLAEKSQFIMSPPYGQQSQAPLKRPILYEIEVLNCNKADILKSEPPNERDFNKLEAFFHIQCTKAGNLFFKNSVKSAIKIYSDTETMVEDSYVYNNAERKQRQQWLVKILTNLVVCYTKAHLPKLTCTSANKVYRICKEGSIEVPVKVHYNHGISLMNLGNHNYAERKLKQADRLLPNNRCVGMALTTLHNLKKEPCTNADIALRPLNVSPEFKAFITDKCLNLVNDTKDVQHRIPYNFTDSEICYSKKEVQKHGLILLSPNKDCDVYVLKKLV